MELGGFHKYWTFNGDLEPAVHCRTHPSPRVPEGTGTEVEGGVERAWEVFLV